MTTAGTKFETELQVRPDDIDMNQHVHGSRYFDYVLAARYDQMARCYKVPMDTFTAQGLAWFIKTAHLDYKRPLRMGEHFIVRTWVADIRRAEVTVQFEIVRKENNKLCCEGHFDYALVNDKTGRAAPIPESIVRSYAI